MSKPRNNLGGGNSNAAAAARTVGALAGTVQPTTQQPERNDAEQSAKAMDGQAGSALASPPPAETLTEETTEEPLPVPAAVKATDTPEVALTKAEGFQAVAEQKGRQLRLAEQAASDAHDRFAAVSGDEKSKPADIKGAEGALKKARAAAAQLEEEEAKARKAAEAASAAAQKIAGKARDALAKSEREMKGKRQAAFHAASDAFYTVKAAMKTEFDAVAEAMRQKETKLDGLHAALSSAFHTGDWTAFDEAVAAIEAAAAEQGE